MKTSIASRIHTFGAITWDLFLSAVGCFVLRRCFNLVAEGSDGPETKPTVCAIGQARDPLAYVGAALILMALTANEQPGLIRAASEAHSRHDAGTVWK
jgi:hypothetical protein